MSKIIKRQDLNRAMTVEEFDNNWDVLANVDQRVTVLENDILTTAVADTSKNSIDLNIVNNNTKQRRVFATLNGNVADTADVFTVNINNITNPEFVKNPWELEIIVTRVVDCTTDKPSDKAIANSLVLNIGADKGYSINVINPKGLNELKTLLATSDKAIKDATKAKDKVYITEAIKLAVWFNDKQINVLIDSKEIEEKDNEATVVLSVNGKTADSNHTANS